MRQIIIDELSREEQANIDSYLKRTTITGLIDGMYWLPLPGNILEDAQDGHSKCGPFLFAIELQEKKMIVELLVRSQSNLHCSCTSYATVIQRNFLLKFIDTLLMEEKITA